MTSITENISEKKQSKAIYFIPSFLILFFFSLSFLPRVQQSENLIQTFWWVSVALVLLYGFVLLRLVKNKLTPSIRVILRPSHYVQAMVQLGVYIYWGWYWRPVYEQATLIIAQLVFLYILEVLISWARGRQWYLGFGVFPIIFSINLFLWFRDDIFILQFVMVTVGVLGKEFITWNKDGRITHIFNPSAFALSVASLLLIATSTSEISWGHAIANTLAYPEYIYVCIFALSLVVQYLFRVTLVTLSAAVTLILIGLVYFKITGVYFFITSDIPIAVFLGLHLLVTDPSTSPRTDFGRIMFGALYGVSVIILFAVLNQTGTPTFYDKLLAVPLLNLTIQILDRVARGVDFSRLWPKKISFNFNPHQLNKLHMVIWIVFFFSLFSANKFGNTHAGRNSDFWEEACDKNLRNACNNLYDLMDNECVKGQPIACAKQGWMTRYAVGVERDDKKAYELVSHACDLGFEAACIRLNEGEFDYEK